MKGEHKATGCFAVALVVLLLWAAAATSAALILYAELIST